MTLAVCAFKNCYNSYAKCRGLKMFRFPRDLKLSKVWVKHTGVLDLLERSPMTLYANYRVCEIHFRPEDILPSGRLKFNAVPLSHAPSDVSAGSSQSPPSAWVDSDVAPQVNYSSMAKYMKKAGESKNQEAKLKEGPGTSNVDSVSPGTSTIESVPCTPSSNIQFMASEITSLQDPDFGTLEESGMGQCILPPLEEETSSNIQGDIGNEEETVESAKDSTNITNTTSSTVMSADVTATKSTDDTQTKSTNRPRLVKLKEESESERIINYMISQKKLDSVIDRLESVSHKLTAAKVGDQYEQFGKYVGSLLRGMPTKKVNSLKKKILADVMAVLEGKEREPPCLKTTGTQVRLDFQATEKAHKKINKEPSQAKCVSTDTQTASNNSNVLHYSNNGSNIPILGGNMPLIFPGVSGSTASFKLLPVIPMSGTPSMPVIPMSGTSSMPMISMSGTPSMPVMSMSGTSSMPMISMSGTPATVVTTPSLGSITSVHSVPLPPSETITTVATSADGTLLAVTIPKSQMSETSVLPEQTSLQSPRGQKRKQTTAAYLIKKVPCPPGTTTSTSTQTVTKSAQDSSLVSQTINRIEKERTIVGLPRTWKDLRDSGGGEVTPIYNPQPTRQTAEPSQSREHTQDSGGGEVAICNPRTMEDEVEYEMDIEEGNELLRIKQDNDLFETVMCDESSNIDIKEEAPDPEETAEDTLNSATDTITPSTTLNCPLCNAHCNSRDDLDRHFSTSHPGSLPPAKPLTTGTAIL